MKSKDQLLLEECYRLVCEADKYIAKFVNDLMDKDQKLSPGDRIKWQRDTVQPFIQENINKILMDKGDKENGDYPNAPYATWLLVQHMDADPEYQSWFLNKLENTIPQFPKLKFLKDRVKVNQILQHLYEKDKDKYNKANPNYAKMSPITACVRDSKLFPSDGSMPRSAQEAYDQLVRGNNNPLFVDALNQAYKEGVTTQPSYQG